MQQANIAVLARQAIEAALKSDWLRAVELNSSILEINPSNTDAKIRLGRAYLQSKNFTKAKKWFKEVLDADPINPIALKNYKLACEKKTGGENVAADPKSLIKEPGLCAETTFSLTGRSMDASDFSTGEELVITLFKKKADIYKIGKRGKHFAGTITDEDIITRLNDAKNQDAPATASFINGSEKTATIMLKTTVPVFRSPRQDVKPYLKEGSIEEPELEIPEAEE